MYRQRKSLEFYCKIDDVLRWVFRKWDWRGGGAWTGLICLRIRTSVGLFLVNAVINLQVPLNAGNFLTSWEPFSISRRTLLHVIRNTKYFICTGNIRGLFFLIVRNFWERYVSRTLNLDIAELPPPPVLFLATLFALYLPNSLLERKWWWQHIPLQRWLRE